VLQYNKRDLPNVAPVEYMDYLLNNRDVQVPSFTGTAHKCEGVFETLNMITRMLLQKYINQNVPNTHDMATLPQLIEDDIQPSTKRSANSSLRRMPRRRWSSTRRLSHHASGRFERL